MEGIKSFPSRDRKGAADNERTAYCRPLPYGRGSEKRQTHPSKVYRFHHGGVRLDRVIRYVVTEDFHLLGPHEDCFAGFQGQFAEGVLRHDYFERAIVVSQPQFDSHLHAGGVDVHD